MSSGVVMIVTIQRAKEFMKTKECTFIVHLHGRSLGHRLILLTKAKVVASQRKKGCYACK
jgi:hypothetical protein